MLPQIVVHILVLKVKVQDMLQVVTIKFWECAQKT